MAHEAFALLWDANTQCALYFRAPHAIIVAPTLAEALPAMRGALAGGDWLAGGLPYEAGAPRRMAGQSLWFGCFKEPQRLQADALQALFREKADTAFIPPCTPPDISQQTYLERVAHAKELIVAGDIYQVNIGFTVTLPNAPSPWAVFAALFTPEAAPHGGLLSDGNGRWWISLSPELFFHLENGTLTARPMKGTAPRHPDRREDGKIARALQQDPKNRAENLMITDLLRNDLAQVAEPGSVKVPALFTIETYPSIHQMTSTVSARLRTGLNSIDALSALFPCGSITGAPKIRAMEVISEIETSPRGIWCGAIGWLAPKGQAAHFSVAIRTLARTNGKTTLSVGSGIVADSDPEAEWRECLAKTAFLVPHVPHPRLLLETMHAAPEGVRYLGLHLARLARSARYFGFPFDREEAERTILAALPDRPERLRLTLALTGALSMALTPLPEPLDTPVPLVFHRLPLPADDWRLFHKSDQRLFHDRARQESGTPEILWVREDGKVTEGSFTNVFVEKDNFYLTPPARLGLLPGVLRAALLEAGKAREHILSTDDIVRASLEERLYIGNALRGLLPARLATTLVATVAPKAGIHS